MPQPASRRLVTEESLESGPAADILSASFVRQVNPNQFGAEGDAQKVLDGAMTSGSAILTSASAGFTAADVGKAISVAGAGNALGGGGAGPGTTLKTTILSRQSSTQVTLAAPATATVSGTGVVWGTDDTDSVQAALLSLVGERGVLRFTPGKRYLVGSTVVVDGVSNIIVNGGGAVIQSHANADYPQFDLRNCANWTIAGLGHDGGRIGPYRPYDYENYGYRIRGSATDIGFDACVFEWFNDGVIKGEGENAPGTTHPSGSVNKNLRITGCRFADCNHIAMLGKYGTATGFVFSNNFLTRVTSAVEIDGQALETAYTTGTGNAVIANNVWTDCTGNENVANALIFVEEGAYDVIVTGNTFRRITNLAGIYLDEGQTVKNYGRITISNNNFEEFQLSSTVVPSAVPTCIYARSQSGVSLKDLTIAGNRFASTSGMALHLSVAADSASVDNIRLVDNEFVDVGCWGDINAGGNDMVRLSLLGAFSDIKVSGNTFTRRAAQLKSASWLRIDGDRTKTQGVVMISDNLFESPVDNDPNPTYLNNLLRLVVTGNAFHRAQLRFDAADGTMQANRFLSAIADIGVSIATACNVVAVDNIWSKDGGGTDYGMRVRQASAITGTGNAFSGYTASVVFLSSGTYLGTYLRNGVLTHGEATDLVFGATTGTKIGTASGQKLSFYGATPVTRPSGTLAAATDAATTQALVNDLRTKLLSLGIIS